MPKSHPYLEAIGAAGLLRYWPYALLQTMAGIATAAGRHCEKAQVHRWYACTLLTEAVAAYGQIGMPKRVETAEALLGDSETRLGPSYK